jgi:predicted HTH transcriptional regulator
MDVSYFVNYNLHVLEQAFKQLQQYIERKERERQASTSYLKLGDLNERQAQIIWMFSEGNKQVVTVKELQGYFGISATTAKTDVMALVNRGILKEIAFNKVKNGYIKGERFSEIVNR